MIKCRRAILEYAEATINIIDMNHGVIIQAFDQFGARLVQDTARINKISGFVKEMALISGLDHFDELIKYLCAIGYKMKSQEEKIELIEDYLINEMGPPN